eukprot:7129998-Prymnesium_polylepis.1
MLRPQPSPQPSLLRLLFPQHSSSLPRCDGQMRLQLVETSELRTTTAHSPPSAVAAAPEASRRLPAIILIMRRGVR